MIDHTLIGFELFRRLFSFKPTEDELKRFPALQDTYKPFTVIEVIPFFAFAGGAWYLWYHAFLALEAWHIERLGPSVALIVPTVYYWMLLSLFLGMISSAPLLHLFYKALLRGRYADYVLYNNMRAGFDTWKLVRGLAVLIVISALSFALLGMDTYMKVTGDGIVVNRFWSVGEQRYPFSSVKAVKSASHFRALNGKAVERPHFVVDFSDGTKWTTRDWLRETEPEQDARLAAFISARSGKTVQPVVLDE
jgi:hypothetical protein